MELRTEQDMIDFCNEVNKRGNPFEVKVTRNSSPNLVQSRLSGIISAEPAEKVNDYATKTKIKELFIQGINAVSYDTETGGVTIDEIPTIYPSGRAPEYEGPMTGVLVNVYASNDDAFMFHMRGGDISSPFGFQGAAAGFGDFGTHPYNVALEEVDTESGVVIKDSTLENALEILPFMKGAYPQPLFVYGFKYNPPKGRFRVINHMKELEEFEYEKKEEIAQGAKAEAYPFLVPANQVGSLVEEISQRDPTQGGFFGPIKESHEAFVQHLRVQGFIKHFK